MTYGKRLKEAIALAGMSRQKLADGMGLSVQAIGMVINGKTVSLTAGNNSKAAQLLAVDGDWLATGKGSPKPATGKQDDRSGALPVPAFARALDVTEALLVLGAAIEHLDDPDARKGALVMLHTYIDGPGNNHDMVDLIARRLAGEIPAVEQVRRNGTN